MQPTARPFSTSCRTISRLSPPTLARPQRNVESPRGRERLFLKCASYSGGRGGRQCLCSPDKMWGVSSREHGCMATRAGTPPYMGPTLARDGMYRELTPGTTRRILATWAAAVAAHARSHDEETMTTRSELARFFEEGWNRHDVDRLMTFMADE